MEEAFYCYCRSAGPCACCREVERLRRQIEELQSKFTFQTETEEFFSSLNFLRLRLDNEQADGIMKGDISFLFQGPIRTVKPDVLYAHKFILASKSPVFCKMFEVNMLESETGVVRIEDATIAVMRAVIGFCYNAEIKFFASNHLRNDGVTHEAVLEVAHKYGIDLLVKKCEAGLIRTIDKVNLPRLLKLARKLDAKVLHAGALEYLKTHFDDVIVPVLNELC